MRNIIVIIFTIIFLLAAFWLGEAGKGLFQVGPYLIGLIGFVVILFLISEKWNYKISYASLFIVFYLAAFYIGSLSFSRAYNSCLEEGEQIRIALYNYKAKNGKYPYVLDDLDMSLPCSRFFRGTIVKYQTTGSNYKIWFNDWLVEYSATEKDSFFAHK
jgi:hypothetical protein